MWTMKRKNKIRVQKYAKAEDGRKRGEKPDTRPGNTKKVHF